MFVKDLKQVLLSDVKVVKDVPTEKGELRYVLFEGDLNHPETDPEVLNKVVLVVQATSFGRLRIIVEN